MNQLRELDPNLSPEEINASTLIDVDANISTDASKPLTVEEIIAEISGEGDQVIDDESEEVEESSSTEVTCPSRNDLDDAIDVLSKLSLFWNDEEIDGLVTYKFEQKNPGASKR